LGLTTCVKRGDLQYESLFDAFGVDVRPGVTLL
jgi:hypothetical protein